jgi:glycosyltransferase involved in cell wall biosynthesis
MYPYEIPDNFGFPKFLVNRMILRQCLHAVDGIACVSETTRERMHKYLPERLNAKAVCIPNCVMPMPETVKPAAADCHRKPFLLCVAQHRRNKNIPLLIRSFARLVLEERIDAQMQLLVIGINGPETERIHRLLAECGLSNRVRLLTGLSEAELHWCYANCEALVAPSSAEGFGLPVAEGLLVGCRVVCSDIEAHREIAADSCRFVNVNGYEERILAEAIAATLSCTRRPEPVNLPQFSSEVVGAQYIRFYRELIEARTAADRRGLGIAVRGI